MRVLTALFEALLVFLLFVLFTAPFFVIDRLNANQINFTTIAQGK